MPESRNFPVRTILTVTSGKLLTKPRGPKDNGIGDLDEILKFLTGDSPFPHQLPRFMDECRRYVIDQHPVLGSPEMQFILGELALMLETPSGRADPTHLILGWLNKANLLIGADQLNLVPIPRDDHSIIDPIDEIRSMAPQFKIIVIERE